MNRFRGPASRTSKATPNTICQKCLKRGHYSYECKASAQERPYASRPSRTQQLSNPKLVPKLSTDSPSEFTRKKGIADEILNQSSSHSVRALNEAGNGPPINGKRSRSSSSFSSVSTISTNRSRSRGPSTQHRRRENSDMDLYLSQRSPEPAPPPRSEIRKRARDTSSSSRSIDSLSSLERSGRRRSPERATRSRRSLISPDERGRRRNRSDEGHGELTQRVDDSSRSSDDFNYRRRYGTLEGRREARQTRDGHRNSQHTQSSGRDHGLGEQRRLVDGPPSPRRERTLSPFSKRLALTQAMNLNR